LVKKSKKISYRAKTCNGQTTLEALKETIEELESEKDE
jgi:hypothetical protein